jgi:GGDEF domain-containing protein
MREYRKRYSDEAFSVIGLKFSNLYEVETSLGEDIYNKIMDELIFRIRSMVRSTDITTSSAPDTFWILLPRTARENSRIRAERIEKLNDMLEITSEKKIEIRARSFQIPAEDDQTPAEQYLAMFAEEL